MEIFKNIRLLATDVDGVLTDGRVFYDGKEWRRQFHIRDGMGLIRLQQAGYQVAIITTSKTEDIRKRAENLKVDYFYEGAQDKKSAFEHLVQTSGVPADQIAFLGDDVIDLPAMKLCGLPIAVQDAMPEVKEFARYITDTRGGFGAFREVCELILKFGRQATP